MGKDKMHHFQDKYMEQIMILSKITQTQKGSSLHFLPGVEFRFKNK